MSLRSTRASYRAINESRRSSAQTHRRWCWALRSAPSRLTPTLHLDRASTWSAGVRAAGECCCGPASSSGSISRSPMATRCGATTSAGRCGGWGSCGGSALADYEPTAVVHRGRLQQTQWSADVCFAGTGPGEVLVGDAKLVGISQRRTREAARFQTMVHLRWRPDVVASLVAASPSVDELAPLVKTCSASAEMITERLIAALESGEAFSGQQDAASAPPR